MRRFYRGEEGGEEFWDVALLTRNGWGLPPSTTKIPSPAIFHAVLLNLHHRRTCSLEVLRPWKYGPPPKEERIIDPKGEWIKLCCSNTEDVYAVWLPSSHPNPCHLQPNPFLSDLSLPLSPPPISTQTLHNETTIIASNDLSIPVTSHTCFLTQLATWPGREAVEVEFVWESNNDESVWKQTSGGGGSVGRGHNRTQSHRKAGTSNASGKRGEIGPSLGWEGLGAGRVVVVVGKKRSGRLVTVEAMLEGMAG
ncbi:hypothetical protein BDY24DRAFT_120661 [Mrakia frigida]|uniref:uncharacterized protein n=1 Tax=Mrakia frigida TaxID=29902 RepID=UPI003FCC0156